MPVSPIPRDLTSALAILNSAGMALRIIIKKFLECLVMLACMPWNFLEHSIMSRSHDVILAK